MYDCLNNYKALDSLDGHYRFATSVCMFGGLLHSSPYLKSASWDEAILLAKNSIDIANPLHAEFLELLNKGKKIYVSTKKKKRREKQE